jgi:hypothetical protein
MLTLLSQEPKKLAYKINLSSLLLKLCTVQKLVNLELQKRALLKRIGILQIGIFSNRDLKKWLSRMGQTRKQINTVIYIFVALTQHPKPGGYLIAGNYHQVLLVGSINFSQQLKHFRFLRFHGRHLYSCKQAQLCS